MSTIMLKKVLCVLSLAGCAAGGDTSSRSLAAGKPELAPPTLAAADATRTSVTLTVCGAGEFGAPEGFSVQWVRADLVVDGAWPEEGCGASFSGNANASPYALGAGDCVDVTVDGTPFEDGHGGSSDCEQPLACGTAYAFRAFAHGGRDYGASDKGAPIEASTAACEDGACTRTQGYWKNHEEAWPVATLTLGTTSYDQAQLLAILRTPVRGNGLVSLAHQAIAAALNAAAGVEGAAELLADADALIGELVIPPVGAGWRAPADTGAVAGALDAFNNGLGDTPHCE